MYEGVQIGGQSAKILLQTLHLYQYVMGTNSKTHSTAKRLSTSFALMFFSVELVVFILFMKNKVWVESRPTHVYRTE